MSSNLISSNILTYNTTIPMAKKAKNQKKPASKTTATETRPKKATAKTSTAPKQLATQKGTSDDLIGMPQLDMSC